MATAADWVPGPATWQHRAMRVQRTFGFIDVSGFTALTELEGDERAVDVLTAVRALLRDICSRRGVRIAKWLGDGVMLVCVETRPLVETVLEIHHVVDTVSGPVETVSIRSGITSGEVILMEGDDYIGHCVNVAARLCDLAAAGEALAAPSVMASMPSWAMVTEERDVSLRGVEKPVPASSIRMARAGEDGSHSTPSADCRSTRTRRRRSRTTPGARSCSSAPWAASTPGAVARPAPARSDSADAAGRSGSVQSLV